MSKKTIYLEDAIDAIMELVNLDTVEELRNHCKRRLCTYWSDGILDAIDAISVMPSADVQPVTFCQNCQWLADIKDVDTGEMYHTCGVLGFDVPDGFACNQGKRKGVDNVD